MKKLFQLKEWLTVPDTATHLSGVFEEEVTEADVLLLALDGKLKMSVILPNGARARTGKIIPIEQANYEDVPSLDGKRTLRLYCGVPLKHEGKETHVIELSEDVAKLRGLYDLPMLGSEALDIQHKYQQLIGGPDLTLVCMEGAFVEGKDGIMCQVQDSFDDNEYQPGSTAQLARIEDRISDGKISEVEAVKLLNKHKEDRKEYLENRKASPAQRDYYPRDGLPEDAIFVVRTAVLREFEASISGTPKAIDHAHVSGNLAKLNLAATKFWANADRDDRSTHPSNTDVVNWLVEHGFSKKTAEAGATIIRPEWAPSGRKPEE